MKKVIAILLAVVMCAAMSVSVFAKELTGDNNKGNGAGDYTIAVSGKLTSGNKAESKISVDITWDAMVFTYNTGTPEYNDTTHKNETPNAGWVDEKKSITVTNHSNCDVEIKFGFTSGIDGINGTFYDKKDNQYDVLKADLQLQSGEDTTLDGVGYTTPSATVYFGISGSAITSDNASLGNITINIKKVENQTVSGS